MTRGERHVTAFSDDIARYGSYAYTANDSLSSVLANRRLTESVVALSQFEGKRVLDIGCGDGTYTVELAELDSMGPVTGLDANLPGIAVARRRQTVHAIAWASGSAIALPFPKDSFDIGVLRGVLHHMDDPRGALAEALRVCRAVVVIEPNGYNPALKIIERCSTYHRLHGEKSYAPPRLDRWVLSAGGEVRLRSFIGLVPMFCPDWMARSLKRIEPLFERLWPLNRIACAVYAFRVERRR